MHAQTNTYACTYAHIHAQPHRYTHTHVDAQIYIYIYIHAYGDKIINMLARRYVGLRKLANMHTYAY